MVSPPTGGAQGIWHRSPQAGPRRHGGGLGGTGALLWRADPDEAEKAEIERVSELNRMEEETHNALLQIRPSTKAAAIAVVRHIAEYGLPSVEIQACLLMLLESPPVS